MLGALQGFVTISAVVFLGWLLADRKVLDLDAQRILADLAFFVASPALLVMILAKAPVSAVLSPHLLVALGSAVFVMAIGYAVSRRLWHADVGESVMAALASGYVNSANLGIPIAIYVLGDATHSAPLLLVQLGPPSETPSQLGVSCFAGVLATGSWYGRGTPVRRGVAG